MSLLGTLLVIGKEMFPFLKETLLEGQTLRAWLRDNWLTFAFLMSTLLLTMMVAHLSDLVHDARHREESLRQQINALAFPARDLIAAHRKAKNRIAELEEDNSELQAMVIEGADLIDKQTQWMRNCGMNISTGACPAPSYNRRPPPRRAPQVIAQEPIEVPDSEERDRKGFLERLKAILGRNRNEDEEDES